ncbi:uncharacterized protein BJ212DRAFT_1312303 [Suillus subaureus]|uniref:Uncharacterized protein n=1 Tax=Suillus subaureus TaxID=48587 RepID=A0A9P7EQQ3_9AGAM|nr:uncharacterized protein BJ212DRAFT_1312303 [Suillus subaureus]KAG1827438.1 hypothetical protein BJ212DRAFT_1312303 [Suillus subaureus]
MHLRLDQILIRIFLLLGMIQALQNLLVICGSWLPRMLHWCQNLSRRLSVSIPSITTERGMWLALRNEPLQRLSAYMLPH